MGKKLVLIVIIIGYSIIGLSVDNFGYSVRSICKNKFIRNSDFENFNPSVPKIKKKCVYSSDYKFGEPSIEKKLIYMATYDENGYEIEETNYSEDGRSTVSQFKKDKLGRISEIIRYNSDGKPDAKAIVKYNSENKRISDQWKYFNLSNSCQTEYLYNKEGKVSFFLQKDENGKVISKIRYVYGQSGNRIIAETYSKNSLSEALNFEDKMIYSHDLNGNFEFAIEYDDKNLPTNKYTYIYEYY